MAWRCSLYLAEKGMQSAGFGRHVASGGEAEVADHQTAQIVRDRERGPLCPLGPVLQTSVGSERRRASSSKAMQSKTCSEWKGCVVRVASGDLG